MERRGSQKRNFLGGNASVSRPRTLTLLCCGGIDGLRARRGFVRRRTFVTMEKEEEVSGGNMSLRGFPTSVELFRRQSRTAGVCGHRKVPPSSCGVEEVMERRRIRSVHGSFPSVSVSVSVSMIL